MLKYLNGKTNTIISKYELLQTYKIHIFDGY